MSLNVKFTRVVFVSCLCVQTQALPFCSWRQPAVQMLPAGGRQLRLYFIPLFCANIFILCEIHSPMPTVIGGICVLEACWLKLIAIVWLVI